MHARFLVLLALAACPTARTHRPAVELRLSADRTTVLPGDTVALTASIRPLTGDSNRVELGCRPALSFVVRSADRARSASSEAMTCGSTLRRAIVVSRAAPYREEYRWVAQVPGEYEAVVGLGDHEVMDGPDPGFRSGQSAPAIAIRVLPRSDR